MHLNIKDVINNAQNELERAKELLNSEEARESMLLSDIESSLERMEDINERIEFALIMAVYIGQKNAVCKYEKGCDNAEWRNIILEYASQVEIQYEQGKPSSEWAYEKACELTENIFKEHDGFSYSKDKARKPIERERKE